MLGGMAAVWAAAKLPNWGASVPVAEGLSIHPRADWGSGREPGPLQAEPEVRFLLVHHTAGRNDYGPDEVVAQLREVFDFHTSAEKGWPDVAYNFFVDRYGGVWEGRAGSLTGPVMADATGGSQGFAQLVCLPGIFMTDEPTPEMVDSLCRLLAWLADRYGLSNEPGATTTFVSRGSNLWPAGEEVEARILSGHRDMSATACPGDTVYALLEDDIPGRVRELRASGASAPATTSAPGTTAASTTTLAPPTTTTEPVAPTTLPTTTSTATSTTVAAGSPTAEVSRASGGGQCGASACDDATALAPWAVVAAGGAVVAGAAVWATRRR